MMPGNFWDYIGAFVLVLVFIYGTRNYWITLFAGFIIFCVFFFSYGYKAPNFKLNFSSALSAIGTAALLLAESTARGMDVSWTNSQPTSDPGSGRRCRSSGRRARWSEETHDATVSGSTSRMLHPNAARCFVPISHRDRHSLTVAV